MRLYSLSNACKPLPFLYPSMHLRDNFRAAKDTILPLLKPIRALDGSATSEVSMPKGTMVLLNLAGCNTSKDLWGDDVEEWKPERWLSKVPQAVDDARVPGVYSNLCVLPSSTYLCVS